MDVLLALVLAVSGYYIIKLILNHREKLAQIERNKNE